MVAWLTSIHSCTSCVEWDGSCVFDLQPGGHFLTHNFVVKEQKSHVCNRSRKTMKAKATHSIFTFSDSVVKMWWHMQVISMCSVTIMWWHIQVISMCSVTIMWWHMQVISMCSVTIMWWHMQVISMCSVTIMWWHTHMIRHTWCPNTVTTMQVTSMLSVTSLMAHACDTAGLMSHFLEQLPSHITFKSGCYHIAVEDLQPFNPHNRD
jgi:hypothetical protein